MSATPLLSATALQTWIGIVSASVAALVGILKYFNYKSKRDRIADVGAAFATTVEALSSDNDVKRMTAAVLLRRFFDRDAEQGGRGTPYGKEAIEVIAGMLREPQTARVQKVLADSLRYAVDLRNADLQNCDLSNAYLGQRHPNEPPIDISNADLYEAMCIGTSFKNATATNTVFYQSNLERAVFVGANCENANFREAKLTRAKFKGAKIGGADFADAVDTPPEIACLLDANGFAPPLATVGDPLQTR